MIKMTHLKRTWITSLGLAGGMVVVVALSGLTVPAALATSSGAAAQKAGTAHSLRLVGPESNPPVQPRVGGSSIPVVDSASWSGYQDTNWTSHGAFRNIAATWNVPALVNCPNGNYGRRLANMAADLGTGSGFVGVGTAAQCQNGSLTYYDYYNLGSALVRVDSVNSGDQISAYVDYTGGGYWLLSVVDTTQDTDFSTLQSCSITICNNQTAEVGVSLSGGCAPSSGQLCDGNLYPLADYDTVKFNSVSVAAFSQGGGLGTSSFGPANLLTTEGVTILSEVTTAINKDAFTVTWKASG
jgi:hypothetical protein